MVKLRTDLPKTKEGMIARGMKPLKKGSKRAREIGRKGGLVKSAAKSYARRLDRLREKGLTDETYGRIVSLMEDRESSELDILLFIERTKTEVKDVKERNVLTKMMLDWHKMKHGTKENDAKIAVGVINLTPQERKETFIRLTK